MTETIHSRMQSTNNTGLNYFDSTQSIKKSSKVVSTIRQLFSAKDIIWAWSYRSIRVRYKQSVLGGLWAILQPAASVAIFSIIFTLFVPVNTSGIPYIVFSYVAMVPWTFFSSSVSDMVDSLVGNMNLVSKIYFPREVLPIAATMSRLLDLAIAAVLFVVLMIYFQMKVYYLGLFFLPVILLIQIALALGLGFIGAALNVFYRDVRNIFALGLQIWFYGSPIIYPVSTVPDRFRPFYFINPMAGVLEAYRDVLLYQRLPDYYLLISASTAIIILIIGYWFFKRVEFQFADVV